MKIAGGTVRYVMLSIVLLLIGESSLNAQEVKTTNILIPSILGIRYYHEYPISPRDVITGSFGMLGIFTANDSLLADAERNSSPIYIGALEVTSSNFVYAIAPSFRLGVRRYYNLSKRMSKGKKTRHNSGNFISFGTYFVPKTRLRNSLFSMPSSIRIGPGWGIRRPTFKRSMFEVSIAGGMQKYQSRRVSYGVWMELIWAWTLNKE